MISKLAEQFKNIIIIMGMTLLLLILGHYAIGVARYIKHSIQGIHTGQALVVDLKDSIISPDYDDYYDSYFEDSKNIHMLVKPYYHWRRAPYKGKAIHIDEKAIRKTIKSPNPGAKKVFMFGGSTMWGTGTSDKYTIASFVQQQLGQDYDVYNFGETAFVSVQELNLLLETLSEGFIPDMVIFYDGVNDVYASLYSPAHPRHPQFRQEDYENKETTAYLITKLLNKTNYIAITERIKIYSGQDPLSQWENEVSDKFDQKVEDAVQSYQHLIKQVKALGDAYGFKTYHFWQPVIFTETRDLHPHEANVLKAESAIMKSVYTQAYPKFKSLQSNDNFYYIADVFHDTTDSIYFDFCHMGPRGNEIIAQKITEHLKLKS